MNRSRTEIANSDALIAELARRRARLAELQHAYAVMDRSKFARLRTLGDVIADMLGADAGRFAAYSRERGSEPIDTGRPAELVPDLRYDRWLSAHLPSDHDLNRQRELASMLPYRPVVSIVMPVYDTPREFLIEAIESVLAQTYPYWELCIADDRSPAPHVREVLDTYAARDPRVHVVYRQTNGHISEASNSAIALAVGDYIGLLDHDDVLAPNALFEVASALNVDPAIDMVYSDEDKLDALGRRIDPFFKPDWSPESFMSKMFSSHFGVYRRSIVEAVGGFRSKFDGSQDYDLVLRFTDRTDRVHHIPTILYSWRIHAESAAGSIDAKPYAYIAARKAIAEAMERRGEPGRVDPVPGHVGLYIPRYALTRPGRVTIVIPSRDCGELLDRCLKSIFLVSTYTDFDIVLVDNGTRDEESLAVIERWRKWSAGVLTVLPRDEPFNFSRLVNAGAKRTEAPYLLLLNNDTEVITPDWMQLMLEQAQRDVIGAVGVKLLYPDDTIQHCGVALGLGGAAGHVNYKLPRYDHSYFGSIVTVNNYSAVTAACMMVRRAEFAAVGGFDEAFAVAYNDVDFCLRLRARGLRNVYIPNVELYHHESVTRGSDLDAERTDRNLREQEMLIERWRIRTEPDPYFNPNFALTDSAFAIAVEPRDRRVVRADMAHRF